MKFPKAAILLLVGLVNVSSGLNESGGSRRKVLARSGREIASGFDMKPLTQREEYFCPKRPDYLLGNVDVDYGSTGLDVKWSGRGLILERHQLTRHCLKIDIKGMNFAEIRGWRVNIVPLGRKDLNGKEQGAVKSYVVKYQTLPNGWHYIMKNGERKLYLTSGENVKEETLPEPIVSTGVEICPLATEGDVSVFDVSLYGCRLYRKTQFAFLYFDPDYKHQATCLDEMRWLGEQIEFQSNAGYRPQDASFESVGFLFNSSCLKEPNTQYYLEMKLEKPMIVFRLKHGGEPHCGTHLAQFALAYFDDKGEWQIVLNEKGKIKIFDDGREHSLTASGQPITITLPHPVVTSKLRLYPQDWWMEDKRLRLNLEACQIFPFKDRSSRCRVPYNLVSKEMLTDPMNRTFLSDPSATFSDPYGYSFGGVPGFPNSEDAFLRAGFSEDPGRIITALLWKGGQTKEDGDIGVISEFRMVYGRENWSPASGPLPGLGLEMNINSASGSVSDGNDLIFIFYFEPPIEARFVDFYPLSWQNQPIVRFSLRGCQSQGHPYPSINYSISKEKASFTNGKHRRRELLTKERKIQRHQLTPGKKHKSQNDQL